MQSGSRSKRRHVVVSSLTCVALLVAGVVIAGCGGSSGSGGSGKGAVAMSYGGLEIEVWDESIKVMKPIVEKAGFEFLVDDPQFKVQKQVQDWEAWIAQGGVKAIMGFPISVDALIPVTERADEAGIAVLGHGENWKGTMAGFLTEPLRDGKRLGGVAGKWINENYSGKPVEVAVYSNKESEIAKERTEGIVEGVEETASNAVIEEVAAYTQEEGLTAAKAQLVAHPDTKVWLGFNDETVLGANQALRNKGVAQTDPNYFLGSLDLTKQSLELMADPDSMWRVGFIIPGPEVGKTEANMLIEAGEGKTVKNVVVPSTEVTPTNVSEFLK